jgi:hypothetical protein
MRGVCAVDESDAKTCRGGGDASADATATDAVSTDAYGDTSNAYVAPDRNAGAGAAITDQCTA